jgi:hypothetical protein
VTPRFESPADQRRLARLAELDSSTPPAEPVLLAEVDGQLRAALALTDGHRRRRPFSSDRRPDRPHTRTSSPTRRHPPDPAFPPPALMVPSPRPGVALSNPEWSSPGSVDTGIRQSGGTPVRTEWRLIMMSHNLTKLHRHQTAILRACKGALLTFPWVGWAAEEWARAGAARRDPGRDRSRPL